MTQVNFIRWRDGRGWIVLSGGGNITSADTGHVEAEALARIPAGGPVAYIWAAGDIEAADRHLEALIDLGAPTGYLVDVLSEDDDSLRSELGDAGMIILGDGPNLKQLRSGILGAALDGMGQAYEHGAVILGIGQGAAVLGSFLDDQPGVGWVEQAAIVPGYEQAGQTERLRELLRKNPDAYGIGIGAESALALGPQGEVETWGKRQITVSLGTSASGKKG
jgi:hypothetical protein